MRRGWRVLLLLAIGSCLPDLEPVDVIVRTREQTLADCTEYCDRLEVNCSGFNRVYDRREPCMATCQRMDYGNRLGGNDANTLSCRMEKLREGIESQQCSLVGPGGAGLCGTNCESYCAMRAKVCSNVEGVQPEASSEECLRQCSSLFDRGDLGTDQDRSGDTVQCRLVYLSEAAISEESAATYCPESQLIPIPGETGACSDPDDLSLEENCLKYCNLVTTACVGSLAVYQSNEQCLAVCRSSLDAGPRGDLIGNTVRCRRYHAYFSMLQPEAHCLHAGPTGDGHCGVDNCSSYCRIVQQACGAEFALSFGSSARGELEACESACLSLDGARRDEFALGLAGRYQVDTRPSGNSLQCRTYHAVEALTAPVSTRSSSCESALGGGNCR